MDVTAANSLADLHRAAANLPPEDQRAIDRIVEAMGAELDARLKALSAGTARR